MVHRFRPVGPWWHGNLLGRHVNALESQLAINFPMVKLFNSWRWWIVDDSSGIVELSKDIISKMLLVQIFSVTTSNNMAQSLTDGYPKNNFTGHDEVVSKCVCVFLSRGLPWFALQREKQQTGRLCYNRLGEPEILLEKVGQVECKLCLGYGLQAHQFGVPVIHLPIIVQGFIQTSTTPFGLAEFPKEWTLAKAVAIRFNSSKARLTASLGNLSYALNSSNAAFAAGMLAVSASHPRTLFISVRVAGLIGVPSLATSSLCDMQ